MTEGRDAVAEEVLARLGLRVMANRVSRNGVASVRVMAPGRMNEVQLGEALRDVLPGDATLLCWRDSAGFVWGYGFWIEGGEGSGRVMVLRCTECKMAEMAGQMKKRTKAGERFDADDWAIVERSKHCGKCACCKGEK